MNKVQKKDRLNADLPVKPLNAETRELLCGILLTDMDDTKNWIFNPDAEKEIPWICRMIRKRIVAKNLRLQITEKAYLAIAAMADSPGKAMYVLHKVCNYFESAGIDEWLLNIDVLTFHLFPMGFPSNEVFNKWWKKQKTPGKEGNLVDIFPDEWKHENIESQVVC